MDLVSIAACTGFIGDALLQIIVKNTNFDWGLRQYFNQHGSIESLCIAAGMLAIFFIIYVQLRLPITWYYLALYGIGLDLLFRETMLFPSLKGYYNHLNFFWSGMYGAIPMMIPYFILLGLNSIKSK